MHGRNSALTDVEGALLICRQSTSNLPLQMKSD